VKKLRLQLDEITVDGFEVLPPATLRDGSVRGQEYAGGLAVTTNDADTCVRASCPTGNPCQHICQ
jgi:hypothetical protein